MNPWEEKLQEASTLVENREHFQKKMGKLAYEISDLYGKDALAGFASEIQETYGLTISQSTLKNYAWVFEKTSKLELPADLSYRTLQYIASSGDPEMWAKRIKDEGLSSAEVYRLIREMKGLNQKTGKTVICNSCGAKIEI